MKAKIAYGNVYPAINTHAYPVGGMVGATFSQHVGVAYMLNERFWRAIGNAIIVFIFENFQVHPAGFAISENRVQYKHLIAHYQDTARVINIGKVCMFVN